jgi:hypothetical protein
VIFGIWPGAVAADLVDLHPIDCPPEDPGATLDALRDLQGRASPFYIRSYRHFKGHDPSGRAIRTPLQPELYAGEGRRLDLVACYQSRTPDARGFAGFVREAVRDVAAAGGGKVQVGEELNMPAPLDGGFPDCFEAVGAGVAAAFDERERLGAEVLIGVNGAGLADPAFWQRLAGAIGAGQLERLDYVGLDAFPDVFARIPPERLAASVGYLVRRFRAVTEAEGVPAATPIHITETGWATDDERDEATQGWVLTTVADAILGADANVTAYELFGLRDGRTEGPWTSRFGLLRDDYSAKPAYAVMREYIARISGNAVDMG